MWAAASVHAQSSLRKIGELELKLFGLSATVNPLNPTVPKNVASGVDIVVSAGGAPLSEADVVRFLGAGFRVQAELSGPGLPQTLTIPRPSDPLPADPLLLPLPALATAGHYTLSDIRIVVGGKPVLDVTPPVVTVDVIDQILVTSVQTRPLTLDEIKAKGIVLDSSAYLGFQFTLGLSLDSKPVSFTFPVVFNRQGVSVPLPITPPPAPTRSGVSLGVSPPLPTIIPVLLGATDSKGNQIPLTLPNGGGNVQIPSVLVIPGNVGYLKQFFAADLYVANGAPAGSGLVVHSVTGTIHLPPGPDGVPGDADDPLSLPSTVNGPQPATLPVRGLGPDGKPDVDALNPGDQGQAEFLIRGEKEGYATIDFDINAVLDGLPVGPVNVTGKASGGVLVRNPFFDMTFTVPSVVRRGEKFKLFTTITNIGQGFANALSVSIDAGALSGAQLLSNPSQQIATLKPGDAKVLEFDFQSQNTGQVVASYLHLDTQDGSTGELHFTLGIGERGVPLSPDTLVLPSSVDSLPDDVVSAAMRVLGQAWSIANAPAGTLPSGVARTSKTIVFQKGLALAEAGLRVNLGENLGDALRDVGFDFYGGSSLDPGFDQVLRQTAAGRALALALGVELSGAMTQAGGALAYERAVAQLAASGPDFISFAVGSGTSGAPVAVTLVDAAGHQTVNGSTPDLPRSEVVGAVILPLGPPATSPVLGLLTAPSTSPYTLQLTATASGNSEVSVTLPRGDGTFVRGFSTGVTLTTGENARLVLDLSQPDHLVLAADVNGDGSYAATTPLATEILSPQGPQFLSASVIGPDTLDGAAPLGFNVALLFDRIVDDTASSIPANYQIPQNSVVSGKRQLSGRIVFATLALPEGPYVPTTVELTGITDARGAGGASVTQPLRSLLTDPGAVVSGRVLNAGGAAVTSGTVTYRNNIDLSCLNAFPSPLSFVPLSAAGRYQLHYVRQDTCGTPFEIATQDPSSGATRKVSSFVRAAGEQIILDLVLIGRGSVGGTVRDLSLKPVPGASVTVLSATDAQSGGSTTTDGNGLYLVGGITVGPVSVLAAQGIFVGRAAGVISRAGTAAAVDVTLQSGSVQVSGTVRLVNGTTVSPLANANVVYIISDSAGSTPVGVTQSGADGAYTLQGMPPGSVTLQALTQYGAQNLTLVTAAGATLVGEDIVFQVQQPPDRSGIIQGVVHFPDSSAAGGVIVTFENSGVLSDATGSFTLTGVAVKPNQSQTVSAMTQDGLRSGSTSFVLGSANQVVSNLVITLSGLGQATFTILDPAGHPVANQELRTPCNDPCGCGGVFTDQNGDATFSGLPLGTLFVKGIRSVGGVTDVATGQATVKRDGDTGFGVVRFAGSGTVQGTVLNPDGSKSFGASVSLSSRHFVNDGVNYCDLISGESGRVQTGTDGRFGFTGVNVGPVGVSASQPFFPTTVGQGATLAGDGQSVTISLKLVNTIAGVLSGTVFLPDGTTPAGAGVQVTASGPLPDITVTTDASGHYHFAKILPAGMYQLTVSDPVTGGLGRDSVYMNVSQDVTHDLRLKGRGTVRVTVVDGGGNLVPSAFVRVRETDYPNRVYEGSLDASNQGVATFENVFEGPLSVEASDSFGRGGRASAVIPKPGGLTIDVKVGLTVTGTVQGHFFLPGGGTPTSVPFGLVSLTAGGKVIGQVTTQGSGDVGAFSFSYVPAGPVRLDAQDPLTGRTGLAVGTLTTQDQVLALDVTAQGLGTVTGLVTSNGQPEAAAHVDVLSGTFHAATYTDGTGNYLMTGVPEGHVVVTASLANNFLAATASGTLVGDGNTLTLPVALQGSGVVKGQVLSSDGLTPASPSLVTLRAGGGGFLQTTSGALGLFEFDQVPTGTATLSASVLGSIDEGVLTTSVPAGGTTSAVITLNGVGSITGVGVDSGLNPVDGTLTVTGTGPFPYSFYLVLSKGSGSTFQLPQVLAGPFTASLTSVSSGGNVLYGTASGVVTPGQATSVTVELQATGTVTGNVLRPGGQTAAYGAAVTVELDRGRGSITVQAQNDGSFTVPGVPLGAFTLRVSDPVTAGLGLVQGRTLDANLETLNLGTIVLDDTPIQVVSIVPLDGATQVGRTQPVTIVFSEQVQSFYGVAVMNGASTVSTASLSGDGLTLTLQPVGVWPDETELTVIVPAGVTDIFARPLAQTVTSHFQVVDQTPPSVTSVAPAPGSFQVAPGAALSVTFSEGISPSLTNFGSLVSLAGPAGPIAGTATLTSPTAVTFTPSAPLATDTVYTVTVNGSVDLAGNTQTGPFTSSFATQDTIPPSVSFFSTTPTGTAALTNGAFVNVFRPTLMAAFADALTGVNIGTATLRLDGAAVPGTPQGNSLVLLPSAPLADGAHTLQATVADNAGNMATATVSFAVDTQPPSPAQLTGVAEGQVVRGTITLGATASDAGSGVARIDILSDGSVIRSVSAPSFSSLLDTTALGEGIHDLGARAVDVAGNVGPLGPDLHVIVDNVVLKVTSLSVPPVVGKTFTATATVNESVTLVTFSIGAQVLDVPGTPGQTTYQVILDATSIPEGVQTETATAYAFGGESASTTATTVVDHTPPAAPDAALINAEPPTAGFSLVFGRTGAVEANAQVEATNPGRGSSAIAYAGADGSFSLSIAAVADESLSLVAVDAVGNRSASATIIVRRTPSLPPAEGTTSLRFEGLLVDRVGLAAGALSPDGSLDAVFTMSLAIGDGVTRQLSFIDLVGPQTRSTRSGVVLGVATDPGAPFLNAPSGQLSFPVTSGATLTLFAADGGFIRPGSTYTVTAGFTDGTRFVGAFTIVAPEDRTQVAHSVSIAASPATVLASAAAPGTAALALTEIRDIEGTLVPDGTKIALSVADMATRDPRDNAIRSAGGAILDGAPAPNNASFRVFTVTGGAVSATYSSAPVAPAAATGALAVVQAIAADAAGNVLGTEAIGTLDLNVRAATDQAVVSLAHSSLYADKGDRRSAVTVAIRDAAGNPVPDGTHVLLSATNSASITPDGCCYIGSAGGQILGGTTSPSGAQYRAFTVSQGRVEAEYSAQGIGMGPGQSATAFVQVLGADANGAALPGIRAIGTAGLTLVGADAAEVLASRDSIPLVFPPTLVQVRVHHLHDVRANLVPDGANVLITAENSGTITFDGCCYVGSAGGMILDGTPSPSGSGLKVFSLIDGEAAATYSPEGTFQGPGQVGTVAIQVAPADPNGARLDGRNVAVRTLSLVSPANAVGFATPSRLLADGALHTARVTFAPVIDAYGNPLPDGSKVVATADDFGAITLDGCCYIRSAGGQILEGSPSPSGTGYKVFTVQGGTVSFTYGDQSVTAVPGETKTVNVSLIEATASGAAYSGIRAIGTVAVRLAGLSSASAAVSPTYLHADGSDRRAVVTVSGIRDSLGEIVPDGTLIALTASDSGSITPDGCCYIRSAGGQVVGGAPAPFGAQYRLFPVANGQVVADYSSQGISVASGEQVATVQLVSVNAQGNQISNRVVATVPVRLLGPASGTVATSPVDLPAEGSARLSQITISGLLDSGGTPIPDGAKVGLAVADFAAITTDGCCYIRSVGGQVLTGGTNPGDGAPALYYTDYRLFTVAGGEVRAVYSAEGLAPGVNETQVAKVVVAPASDAGAILSNRAFAVGTINLRGTTSATASGPATLAAGGHTAAVTFTGIKDSAGNTVPDGTLVVAAVADQATIDSSGCCYNRSTGGTILDGGPSPSGGDYKVFSVVSGSVTLTYSTAGASAGTARVQLAPARPDGRIIGNRSLVGGVWAITVN